MNRMTTQRIFSYRTAAYIALGTIALLVTGCGGGGSSFPTNSPAQSTAPAEVSRILHIEVPSTPPGTEMVTIRTRSIGTLTADAVAGTGGVAGTNVTSLKGLTQGAGSETVPVQKGSVTLDIPVRGQIGQQVRIEATAIPGGTDASAALGFAYVNLVLSANLDTTVTLTPLKSNL